MKYCLFLLLIVTGITSCEPDLKTYEQAKSKVVDQEQDSPISFLRLKGTWHRNIIGQWVYEGTITSTAALAKYKEPVLELKYYGADNEKLGSETVTIDKQIDPKTTVDIKVKEQGYKGTKKVTATLIKVSAVE